MTMSVDEDLMFGSRARIGRRAHVAVLLLLQSVMAVELVLLIAAQQWLHTVLVIAVMSAIVAPELVRSSLRVEIPSEVQLAASLFVFASLFLGEVRDFYERFWWWDSVLHATAGLLLGVLGFIILFVLNESGRVPLVMRASLVALLAFLFSLGLGTMWEIFEFAMDQAFGLTMQKPVPGDPSGLTDTMRDLVVDCASAAIISIAGWWYIRRRRPRYLDLWVARAMKRRRFHRRCALPEGRPTAD